MQLFSQVTTYRNMGFAGQWEEVASLIEPSARNTFYYGNYNTPGMKKTQHQIDATGMMANARFAAICDSLLTPSNMIYQRVAVNDEYVMKDRKTRLWCEQVTNILHNERYAPTANFAAQNHANFRSLGAFGNLAMFIDELDDPEATGLRYAGLPMGEVFFITDHQNRVIGFIRWFKFTARQAHMKWPGQLPPNLQTAYQQQSENKYNFIHVVMPRERDDYDPQRLDARGKRWQSLYISIEGRCLMYKAGKDIEGGYRTFPLAAGRYSQAPDEIYGRGWAMDVMPSLKTLNAQKRIFLRAGHLAVDPIKLTRDDGMVGFKNRPGAMNPGGVSEDGKVLIHNMPIGDVQIGKEMMQEERAIINDNALVTLFQILVKTPQMSATEVIERANEKGILLAPTMGRQQGEYLHPMTMREMDILAYQGKLPPMPPRMLEAMKATKGKFHLIFDNPLSRLAKAQEGAGFLRTLESVHPIAQATGDPSIYDPFNFKVAVPALAQQNAVPESWMADADQMTQKAQARAKAQAADQQMKNLPNQAAMVKAQAFAAKNNPQGQPGQPQMGQQPQPGQPQMGQQPQPGQPQ
jgi:hypothetical protein